MPVHVDCTEATGGEANAPSGDEAGSSRRPTATYLGVGPAINTQKPYSEATFRVYTSHAKSGTVSLLPPTERALIAEEADTNSEITTLGEIATCFVTEKRGDVDQES